MALSKEKIMNLVKLRDISLLTVDFIVQVSGPNPKDPDFHMTIKNIIRDTYKQHDMKGLMMVAEDMNEWARMLPAKVYALYKQKKEAALQYDASMFTEAAIFSLVNRGKIVTYSEYCLAADCIAQKDADPEKARALQRMVAAYESM